MTDEPEEPTVLQAGLAEVKTTARKAYYLEVALVGLAAIAIAVAAFLSAWNTFRLREVAEDAGVAAEASRIQGEFNERLAKIVAEYNEAHAKSTAESHAALADALACSFKLYLRYPNITEVEVATCYRPTAPAPPEPEVPPSPNSGEGKKK